MKKAIKFKPARAIQTIKIDAKKGLILCASCTHTLVHNGIKKIK